MVRRLDDEERKRLKRLLYSFYAKSEKYRRAKELFKLDESPHRKVLPEILAGCGSVMDLACGTGDNLPFVPTGMAYTGCEFSPMALTQLREREDHSAGALSLVSCDVEALPLASRTQDAIISSYSFEHFLNVPKILKECHRVLRPGGLFVVFGPDLTFPNNYGPPQNSVLRHSKRRLYLYALARTLRRFRYDLGANRTLFEYIRPGVLKEDTFFPDLDMTHLTSHERMADFMGAMGYQRIQMIPSRETPKSWLRRILWKYRLWGNYADTLLVLRKGPGPDEACPVKFTEVLVHGFQETPDI